MGQEVCTPVCNVATQPGETDNFTCGDHLQALEEHIGGGLFDLVVSNNRFEGELFGEMKWVRNEDDAVVNYPHYQADLINPDKPWHHNADKLATVLFALLQERTGPLVD